MWLKLLAFYQANFKWILVFTILGLLFLAWANRFIQDDAFISFRYADNLVRGKGLVWNEGERVEGYTNFLWTLIIALPIYWGLDPATFSYTLGLIFFFFSLVFTYKLSLLIFDSRDLALLTIFLLGTNYTFSAFATGGLETSWQACVFVTSVYWFLQILNTKDWKTNTLVFFSCLLSVGLLVRLDSALLVMVVLPVIFYHLWRNKSLGSERLTRGLALILPLLVLVGGWIFWKGWYYGELLPNTFYAKVSSLTSVRVGVYYLYLFFITYWLIPFPLLLLFAFKKLLRKENWYLQILSILILLWCLYIVIVGGDFMEFRFLVPVLPLGFIMMVWLIFIFFQQKRIRLYLLLLILLGAGFHAFITEKSNLIGGMIETKYALQRHLKHEDEDWVGIGKVLGKSFNYDPEITIATTTAGAIPYYSRLKTVDMLGLNDKWVARHGEVYTQNPGHLRVAPFSYLLARKVNLIIGFPYMEDQKASGGKMPTLQFRIARPQEIPPEAKLVAIPINQNYKLIVLYLFPHAKIDQVIKSQGWKVYPLALRPAKG